MHCNLVNSFKESLPPISSAAATPDRPTMVGMNLATHTLAHCSVIELQSALFDTDPYSTTQSLLAAMTCVQIWNDPEADKYFHKTTRLNPFMGVLWGFVCDVFLARMWRLRTGGEMTSFTADALRIPTQDVYQTVAATFEKFMSVMDKFAPKSRTISASIAFAFPSRIYSNNFESGASLRKSLDAYRMLKGSLDTEVQLNYS